jgi:hypothetical protein
VSQNRLERKVDVLIDLHRIAIDMFQEHVLKEGPQHNESALEQLKDKQIADTLRKTLGIEKKDQN